MLDSPYRLTALTIAASAIAVLGLLGSSLHPVYASLPLLSASFLCVVVGALGMYWTSYTLREDVRNERWPEETLAPFRSVTGHLVWHIGMAILFLAMLAALMQGRHHRTWFWAILFLLQTQTQINSAFARPRKPLAAGARPDRSQIAPLRSEHWGER